MMSNIISIGVATTSEAKIEGIKSAFQRVFPDSEIIVYPEKTESGVEDQPFGRNTAKGALKRIVNIDSILNKKDIHPDYYVSCEAGIDDISVPGQFFSEQVVCLFGKKSNRIFWGKSSAWTIPEEDIKEIKQTDLDQYLKKRGCTGLQDIADGKYITRSMAVEEGVRAALASERNFLKSKEINEQKKSECELDVDI